MTKRSIEATLRKYEARLKHLEAQNLERGRGLFQLRSEIKSLLRWIALPDSEIQRLMILFFRAGHHDLANIFASRLDDPASFSATKPDTTT